MSRIATWRVLVVVVVMATTAAVIYAVRQHSSGVHTAATAASHSAPQPSPSPPATIVKLRQSFVADPPFGSGFTTHGTYLQVSGVDGLDAVNAALRELIVDDQARYRSDLAQITPPATTPPGEYGSGPGDPPAISASSVIVSVLLKD